MIEYFGSNLARLRKERGLTQQELAEQLGMNKQTISNIEKGKSYPTFRNLEKISQTLNASHVQLFGSPKEVTVSDIPVILDRIDEYDEKIQAILKTEVILNEWDTGK